MMMARQVVSHAKETPKGWINQAGYGTGTEPVRNRYGTGTEREELCTGCATVLLCYVFALRTLPWLCYQLVAL